MTEEDTNLKESQLAENLTTKKDTEVKVTAQDLIKEAHVAATLAEDKGGQAQLVMWEVVDFTKKGDNFACIVTSVVVTYTLGGGQHKVTYVVKCNPCRQGIPLQDFNNALFEKEIGFYQHILPRLNAELRAVGCEWLRLPTCYFIVPEKGKEVMFLKDLRADGFKMFDRQKGMDEAHTSLVLQELGRLHAASVLMQAKQSESIDMTFPFLQKDFHSNEEQFTPIFSYCFTNAADMLESIGGYDKVVTWLRNKESKIYEIYADLMKRTPPFDLLCHGDCWNNNVLFKYDESLGVPVEVRLVDLQVCRQASPATDLNYLLYTSLNGPVRKHHLNHFLRTYHTAFLQVLEAVPFSLQELKREYHSKNMFGLIMGVLIAPVVLSEETEVMDMDEFAEVDMEQLKKDYREKMLMQLKQNPRLKPRLLAIFDDMLEYGVIP